MKVYIIRGKISKGDLHKILAENYETMVKVDVDVERGILAIGGEWHSEGDEALSADGSSRENVWGLNFYPFNPRDKRIEYISLINIKPSVGHRNMEVKDENLRRKIRMIIEKLLLSNDETL